MNKNNITDVWGIRKNDVMDYKFGGLDIYFSFHIFFQ